MKKINLSSIGSFMLSIVGTCLMIFLTVLVFIADNSNLFGQVASIIILLVFMFVLYLCIFNRIIIDKEYLVIWKFKKIFIPLSQIKKIYITEFVLENIIYIETDFKTYRISGKSTLLGKNKNKEETKKVVQELCHILGF